MIDMLVQDSGSAIPASVRSLFQAHDPRVARQTSDSAFTSNTQLGTEAVWAQVQNIERRANKCFRRHMDEHAWCDVVQLVLQLALGVAGGANPNFNSVQSQAVDSGFLPQIRKHDGGGLRHVDKRTDIAIGFDTETGLHVDADPEHLFLSPMTDAYTATIPLVCGLEVKRLGGSEEEAQLQLMVWQTAMRVDLDYLRKTGGIPTSHYHRSWRGPSRTILGESMLLGNSLTVPFTPCGRLPNPQLPRVLAQKTQPVSSSC